MFHIFVDTNKKIYIFQIIIANITYDWKKNLNKSLNNQKPKFSVSNPQFNHIPCSCYIKIPHLEKKKKGKEKCIKRNS